MELSKLEGLNLIIGKNVAFIEVPGINNTAGRCLWSEALQCPMALLATYTKSSIHAKPSNWFKPFASLTGAG